jgi:predicted MFS family arabinose efflux permease
MFKEIGPKNRVYMAANLVYALGIGFWINLRPLYLADLGASPTQVGTALALAALAAGIAPIPAGYLIDRIDPQRVILGAWLVGTAGTLTMALGKTWQVVAGGSTLYALHSACFAAGATYILANVPEEMAGEHAERILSKVYYTFPVAMIIGPALGGLLAQGLGMRAAFWAGAACFATAIAIITVAGPSERGPVPVESSGSPAVLLRNRSFLVLAGFFALMTLGLQVGYVLVPNYLQDVRGYPAGAIGTLFSIHSVGHLGANLILAHAGPRFAFVLLLALPWLALLGLWQGTSVPVIGMSLFLLGGVVATWILKAAYIGRAAGARTRGMALGLMDSLTAMATALAAWLAGQLYALTPGHELPLLAGLLSIPPLLVAGWFLLRAAERRRAGAEALAVAPGPGPGTIP